MELIKIDLSHGGEQTNYRWVHCLEIAMQWVLYSLYKHNGGYSSAGDNHHSFMEAVLISTH